MDASTEELRHAHDVLAEWYATNLVGALESMPVERAMLDLFAEVTLAVGAEVADVGCGTGRLLPYLASRGLAPRGVDLSPGMIEVARREHPGFAYEVADLRELPFEDASLAGVVCWFSLIYLAPDARAGAFAELARVVKPGGYLVAAVKYGDGTVHRNGPASRVGSLGLDFDRYWLSAQEMADRFAATGFAPVFQGHTPPEAAEPPYGYLLVRKTGLTTPATSNTSTPLVGSVAMTRWCAPSTTRSPSDPKKDTPAIPAPHRGAWHGTA